jgi:hypothetical protein
MKAVRTNNDAEGWHNRLNQKIRVAHPWWTWKKLTIPIPTRKTVPTHKEINDLHKFDYRHLGK